MRGTLVVCLLGLLACGGGDDGPEPDFLERDTFAPSVVRAGTTIPVTCLAIGPEGQLFVPPAEEVVLWANPPDAVESSSGGLIARTVGTVAIACGVDADHLDPSGAVVEIQPGPAAAVTTTLDSTTITAGEAVTATCAIADAYGNPITDAAPSVRVTPRATGNSADGLVATFTRAGTYAVGCHLDGVPGDGVAVTVDPALPAAIHVAVRPVEVVVPVGATVVMTPRVDDRYGNEVLTATTQVVAGIVTGSGPMTETGPGAWQFGGDGLYRLTATVLPPTDGDVPLVTSENVTVDSVGPAIACVDPLNAAQLAVSPGASTFHGAVADPAAFASVTVDGTPVAVAADGTFSAPITTRFGVNTLHVIGTDAGGIETDRTCSFVVGPVTASEDAVLPRTATLRFIQGALGTVVAEAHTARPFFAGLFTALGPLGVLLPECSPRLGSTLIADIELSGADNVLPYVDGFPIDGGISLHAYADDLVLHMQVRGEQDGAVIDHQAGVHFGGFDATLELDLALDGSGRVSVTPRVDTLTVTFGDIGVAVSGGDPDVLDVLQRLADGSFQTNVREAIGYWLVHEMTAEIDAQMGALDLGGTETVQPVDRLDSGTIELRYATAADAPAVDATRLLFRLGTAVTAPAGHAREGATPLVAVPGAIDPVSTGGNAVAAVHAGMIGQVLHALWRAGFYDATVGQAILVSAGASMTPTVQLPPAVSFTAGPRVVVDLGGIDALITVAGLLDNLPVSFSVRASADVDVTGADLTTGTFQIDELVFATGSVSMDQATHDTVEILLRRWASAVLAASFDGGFAATPAPILGAYHLWQPTADAVDPHLLITGALASF